MTPEQAAEIVGSLKHIESELTFILMATVGTWAALMFVLLRGHR